MDLQKLNDNLTEAFIQYQFNLDHPFPAMPVQNMTATQAAMDISSPNMAYRTDPYFRAKVQTLVAGVMAIVQETL